MNRTSLALTAATAAALVLPATGSAHQAPCIDGRIVPDYLHLDPVITTAPDGSATVRWSDGYTVQVAACAPAPVPVVVVTPGEPVTPTPVIVTNPQPVTTPKPKPRRPRPTCAQLRRAGAGPLTYARLGHYPSCVVPRTIRHPRRVPSVPVAG